MSGAPQGRGPNRLARFRITLAADGLQPHDLSGLLYLVYGRARLACAVLMLVADEDDVLDSGFRGLVEQSVGLAGGE